MNSSQSNRRSPALLSILWGGLACGVLDLTSAIVAYGIRGVKPIRIPQSIASGILGVNAYTGGLETAALGTSLHFLIAFVAASVYYLASRKLASLARHAIVSGLLYGEAVYLFMNFVVIPLSATHRGPFTIASLVTGPVGHPFLVGLPIALAVRRYSSQS